LPALKISVFTCKQYQTRLPAFTRQTSFHTNRSVTPQSTGRLLLVALHYHLGCLHTISQISKRRNLRYLFWSLPLCACAHDHLLVLPRHQLNTLPTIYRSPLLNSRRRATASMSVEIDPQELGFHRTSWLTDRHFTCVKIRMQAYRLLQVPSLLRCQRC
jgi:hypothetical protein